MRHTRLFAPSFAAIAVLSWLAWAQGAAAATPDSWRKHHEAGQAALERRAFAEAGKHFDAALAAAEREGPETARVATGLLDRAELLADQGKYAERGPLLRRVLAIRHEVLEPDHPDMAQSHTNLGALYTVRERYAESAQYHAVALAIRKKAYGRAHESVGQSHYNLGVLYRLQNRFAEAESHYRRAMAVQEKALGPMHPSLGDTLSNYAVLLMLTGRGAEAVPLQRRGAEIRAR